jgi:hypothetical protein
MNAITIAAEDTTAANAAITAEATVAVMPAARTAAVMHEEVSVEVSTAVEVDSTVVAAIAVDTVNSSSTVS